MYFCLRTQSPGPLLLQHCLRNGAQVADDIFLFVEIPGSQNHILSGFRGGVILEADARADSDLIGGDISEIGPAGPFQVHFHFSFEFEQEFLRFASGFEFVVFAQITVTAGGGDLFAVIGMRLEPAPYIRVFCAPNSPRKPGGHPRAY